MKVSLTRQAERDLGRIQRHLMREVGSRTALIWSQRLSAGVASLENMPRRTQTDARLGGRHRLVISPYLIVYRLSADRIVVSRVVDGRRDLPKLFMDQGPV